MAPPRCFSCGGCASDAVRDAPSPRRPQTPRRSPAVAFLFGSAPFLTVLTRTASRRLWCGRAGRSQGAAGASALGTGPPGGSACAPWVSGHPRRGRREQRPGAAELTSRAAVPTVCGSRDRRSYENPVPEGPRRGRGGALAPGLQTRGAGLPCWPLAPCSGTGTAPQPGSRTQEHELARLCFAFPGSRSWWRPGVSTRCVPTSAPWLCLDTPAPQAPVTQQFPHRGKQTRPARRPSPAVAVAMAA